MKYVVIDTCSWINLISENEFNPHISLLVFWIEQSHLNLLIPENVINEWNVAHADEIDHMRPEQIDHQICWRRFSVHICSGGSKK